MKMIRFATLGLAMTAITTAAAPVIADHHELSIDGAVNKHDSKKGRVVSHVEKSHFDDHHSKSREKVVLKDNSLSYSQYYVTDTRRLEAQ